MYSDTSPERNQTLTGHIWTQLDTAGQGPCGGSSWLGMVSTLAWHDNNDDLAMLRPYQPDMALA